MALTNAQIEALKITIESALGSGDLAKLKNILNDVASTDFSQLQAQLNETNALFKEATEQIDRSRQAALASAKAQMESQKQIAETASNAEKRAAALLQAERENLEVLKAKVALGLEDASVIAQQEQGIRKLEAENVKLNEKIKEQGERYREAAQQAKQLADNLTEIASGNIVSGLAKVGKQVGKLGFDKLSKKIAPELMGSLSSQLGSFAQAIGGAGATAGTTATSVGSLTASIGALGTTLVVILPLIALAVAALVGMAVVVGISKKIFDLGLQVANARRELELFSGASQEFTMSVIMGAEKTRLFGVSAEELGAVAKELTSTFTDFTMMSKEAAQATAVNAALMVKLGMSAGDVAKSYQNLSKVFGQTGSQADITMRELEALARDIGVSPAKMGADFAAAGSQLAKLGSDGPKAFRDLAVAAKITNFEVGRLLQITEKFDTFDGAAEQVGKLNAALGGNFVNAMELMTETDPAARFGMIRDAILDAGKSFDTMSYYERNFFAQAAGLNDVGELALMLKGDMKSLNGEIGKNSAHYEEAAKRARNLQSVQDSLAKAFDALIPVIQPVIEYIESFAKAITENVAGDKQKGLSAIAIAFKVIGNEIVSLLEPFGELMKAMTSPSFGDNKLAIIGITYAIKSLLSVIKAVMMPFIGMAEILTGNIQLLEALSNMDMDLAKKGLANLASGALKATLGWQPIGLLAQTNPIKNAYDTYQATSADRAAAPTYATNNAINSAVTNTANYYGNSSINITTKLVDRDGRTTAVGQSYLNREALGTGG